MKLLTVIICILFGSSLVSSNRVASNPGRSLRVNRKSSRQLPNLKCGEAFINNSLTHKSKAGMLSNRIVDGQYASEGYFPFIVRIMVFTFTRNPVPYYYNCTGAIIDKRLVLTAATCLDPKLFNSSFEPDIAEILIVNIGVSDDYSGIRSKVIDYRKHENYTFKETDDLTLVVENNIAILQIADRFEFDIHPEVGTGANSVCLPPSIIDYKTRWRAHYFTGWGDESEGGHKLRPTRFLKKGLVVILERDECIGYNVTEKQMCLKAIQGDAVPCLYEFGSVTVTIVNISSTHRDVRWQLSGIYSNPKKFSLACNALHEHALTRVDQYLDWIEEMKQDLNMNTQIR